MGPRGEIQAPACAAFLFRPSSTSHWLHACGKSPRHPNLQGLRSAWTEMEQNTVDNVDSKRPNWNCTGRAPGHTADCTTTQPGSVPSLRLFSGSSPITYSPASKSPGIARQIHLECANPTDHHGGTTIEWHHLLGWPVLLFAADSLESISKSDPDHLIKSHGLKLVPTDNQCCLSYTPTNFPTPRRQYASRYGKDGQVNHKKKHKCV